MMMARETPRPDPEGWRDRAACKTRRDLEWHPVRGRNLNEQRQVCAGCPVRTNCLADALASPFSEDFGVRGGLSVRERRSMRRNP